MSVDRIKSAMIVSMATSAMMATAVPVRKLDDDFEVDWVSDDLRESILAEAKRDPKPKPKKPRKSKAQRQARRKNR